MANSELFDSLDKLQKKVENSPKFDRSEFMHKKRGAIALLFVRGYLFLVLLIIVGVPLYNSWIGKAETLDLTKTLTEIGTLLGTPLGFVVGYYFKDDNKKS